MRTYVRRSGVRVRRDYKARIRTPRFVDPLFWIQGSSIEKMVMVEFIRRGIYFEHTIQVNYLPWKDFMLKEGAQNWEPDFLLPQHKIWIECQGTYFHSLPGVPERDALRFAYIESVGWRPIAWWEDDIRNRLQDLFDAVPEFYMVDREREGHAMADNIDWWLGGVDSRPPGWATRPSPGTPPGGGRGSDRPSRNPRNGGARTIPVIDGPIPYYEGGVGIDHLAGLRKALRGRGRPPQLKPMKRRGGRFDKRRPK